MPKGLWWIVEIFAFCACLAAWAIVAAGYASLPAVIPTHFTLSGKPNGFGERSSLWLLLAVHTGVYVLLTSMPFFPHLINVPGERTERTIGASIAMVRVLKLEVMLLMAFLCSSIIRTAQGQQQGTGAWPLVFVGLILSTVAIGLYSTTRHEN